MAAASQEVDEEITNINVTPLVDIVLVLLIIFMVTANFIVRETMEVDLPRAANAGEGKRWKSIYRAPQTRAKLSKGSSMW